MFEEIVLQCLWNELCGSFLYKKATAFFFFFRLTWSDDYEKKRDPIHDGKTKLVCAPTISAMTS